MKKIIKQYHADEYPMGNIRVKQPLPHRGLDQIDPFLLLHHAKINFKGGEHAKNKGVPPHPHRGFAPVTFIFEGAVHHRDSMGNSSVVPKGGIQWMNSGKGVVHSERPSKELAEAGGVQEIIQLWINVPKVNKMKEPDYQGWKSDDFPKVYKKGKSYLELIVGDYDKLKGPVNAYSNMLSFKGEIFETGESVSLKLPKGYNAFIYVLSGKLSVGGQDIDAEYLGLLDNQETDLNIEFKEATKFIIMSGEPLNEPVVAYGPFVMNTKEEIMQAYVDYEQGRMGNLQEQFN